jgi:SAM-dependent methyltransferase
MLYESLFVPAGAADWRRAVEIGPGSGKYTLKLLERSAAVVRAYDVSPRFLEVCGGRCESAVAEGRLSLHLIDAVQPDQILGELESCGWRRELDAFFSIDAMVHVDLQYMIVYLVTAALALKPGGKLILTLANVNSVKGFEKLLADALPYWRTQTREVSTAGKFEWLSPDMVQAILPRLGFEITLLGKTARDLKLIASLVQPEIADGLEGYIRRAPEQVK